MEWPGPSTAAVQQPKGLLKHADRCGCSDSCVVTWASSHNLGGGRRRCTLGPAGV